MYSQQVFLSSNKLYHCIKINLFVGLKLVSKRCLKLQSNYYWKKIQCTVHISTVSTVCCRTDSKPVVAFSKQRLRNNFSITILLLKKQRHFHNCFPCLTMITLSLFSSTDLERKNQKPKIYYILAKAKKNRTEQEKKKQRKLTWEKQ